MLTTIIKNVSRNIIKRSISSAPAVNSKPLDPQHEAMLKDQCYLVDENDRVIGTASKKECHLVQEDGNIPLHRAFSVFLFNKKGDLLLQKRSSDKVSKKIS